MFPLFTWQVLFSFLQYFKFGRTLRADTRAHCKTSPRESCGGKIAMRWGFIRVCRFSPAIIIFLVLHINPYPANVENMVSS